MSTSSDFSSGHPLCKCGVPARIKYSWTSSNPGKKWYGCLKYKKAGDCDFFVWADKEMSPYEKGMAKYLKELEDKRVADNDGLDAFIEEKCNQHYEKLRRDLELGQNDKVDAMIGKKCKKHYDKLRREFGLGQNTTWMMLKAALLVAFLLLVFYVSGYSETRSTTLMFK